MTNSQLYFALKPEDYSWRNALLWGYCRGHNQAASHNYWYTHKVIAVLEFPPVIGQIISIFEKIIVVGYNLIANRTSSKLSKKIEKKEEKSAIPSILKKTTPIQYSFTSTFQSGQKDVCTRFSLEKATQDEIEKEMESIFDIYQPGFCPTRNKNNLKEYVRSPKYIEHCKTARVYSSQMDVNDAKKILHQREPVNIGMKRYIHTDAPYYNPNKLDAKFHHRCSAFNADHSPYKTLPNTVAVYSETSLWKKPGQKLDKNEIDVACLSLPAPALDSKDQPHWNYYMDDKGRLKQEKYKAEMDSLAQMIVKVVEENSYSAFKGEGIKRVIIPRYGQGAFLQGIKNPEDRQFAHKAYYKSLIHALSKNHSQFKGIEFRISEFNDAENEEIKNQLLKKLDSSKFRVELEPGKKFEGDEKEDNLVRIGLINGDILESAEEHDLIINAWDPHSSPGNGCDSDRSFDGALGMGTGITVVQSPWMNTFLYQDSRYVDAMQPGLLTDSLKETLDQVNKLDPLGKFYMGSYPGDIDPIKAKKKLEAMVKDLKITTFLSLLDKESSNEKNFAPYDQIAQEIAGSDHPLTFEHFSTPDMGITDDKDLWKFIKKKLIPLIEKTKSKLDSNVYIHCWGGHGRTGVIASIVMAILYDLTAEEALVHVSNMHRTRKNHGNTGNPPGVSPQTDEQKNQVKRMIEKYRNRNRT